MARAAGTGRRGGRGHSIGRPRSVFLSVLTPLVTRYPSIQISTIAQGMSMTVRMAD